MLSKIQGSDENACFLKIFDVTYVFLILNIMWYGDHVL